MERQILRVIGDFFESEAAKAIGAKKNALGGKVRAYRAKYEKDELTPKAALLLLVDCDRIQEIKFKDN